MSAFIAISNFNAEGDDHAALAVGIVVVTTAVATHTVETGVVKSGP